ncbi:MAG: hypothetical protein FWG09_05790, partial [Synergistaceae bacterium]|nr:hypothetical protein [Synergistaceae bacterium]
LSILQILALAAYIIIVMTASGTLRRPLTKEGGRKFAFMQGIAWGAALLSTFGLPWGGIPLSHYVGAGSWTWFLFALISLCALSDDGRERFQFRRFFAVANVAAIMAAIFAFMHVNGIPGDIPGIEGVGAISSLEGLIGKELTLAHVYFTISAIASFLPVYSRSGRAHAMLSFSYSSFLAIVFLPPARMFFFGAITPGAAIVADAAGYFIWALIIHIFVMDSFSELAVSARRYAYVALNAALTAAGVYFLFAAA